MNILGLLEKFLNREESPIAVNQDFCVRLKTPMAGCYECIDRCPDLSIKITDNDIKILENCSFCNACVHICPNSVFYIKKNKLRDEADNAEPLDNIYYSCAKTEPYFKRGRNIKAAGKINKIECVYEVDDLDLILSLRKEKKIFFITADCKSCSLKYFYNKKSKRIDEIKKLLNAEGRIKEINIKNFDMRKFLGESAASGPGNQMSSPEKADDNDTNKILGRREFFKNSFKGFKNNAKKIIEDLSIEDLPLSGLYSEYIEYGNKNEKKINKLLIERQKKLYLFLKENNELLPLLNIRLPKLNGNCVFCSNCWELCPTGALMFKENSISLEPFLCTGCNLCRDICSFGAVKLYRAKKIKDVSRRKVLLTIS